MVKMAMEGLVLLLAVSCVMLMPITEALPTFNCPTAFWVFGDSLTDTGNTQVAFPRQSKLVPPFGESYTFRDKPGLNRFSDGRLIIDFVAQAFRYPFFGTYLHTLNGANYVKGANFAYSGATANMTDFITPFYLNLQVDQFVKFKSDFTDPSLFRLVAGLKLLPVYLPPLIDPFSQGAYYIPEIGGNDFAVATLGLNLPSATVIAAFVPAAAAAVKQAITTLHSSGGRLFFLGNTPARMQPCTAQSIWHPSEGLLNCVADINAINQAYGVALQQVVAQLQATFTDSLIYLFDNYNASVEIFTNPATYGFTNTNQSCCGTGGPYNYDSSYTCGSFGSCCPGLSACANPASYVSWDGIHYTEAFYRQIAKFFLNGLYISPPLNLTTKCYLDFSAF